MSAFAVIAIVSLCLGLGAGAVSLDHARYLQPRARVPPLHYLALRARRLRRRTARFKRARDSRLAALREPLRRRAAIRALLRGQRRR